MIITREDYYKSRFIRGEIVKQLKHRFLSFRRLVKGKTNISRYYQGGTIDLFEDALERHKVFTDPSSKIYFDLTIFEDEKGQLPVFSFNTKKRNEQKKAFTGKGSEGNFKKMVKGYDFAIDLDCKNTKNSWKEAKKIKEILDDHKVPYSLRFSGTKGFHFVVDSKFIDPKVGNPMDLPDKFAQSVKNIVIQENLKYVDESIYDIRRVLKLAYSLCNNDGVEYVCLPLDDEQFKNWKIEDMKMYKVLKDVKIFRRGLLERDFGLSENQLKDNFLKFIKEYS